MAARLTDLTIPESETTIGNVRETVVAPVTAAAFWSAVALPFLHLPLLLLTGLSSQSTTTAFLALVALNVVTLLVGHPYYRD
ncbi:MAG: hypothetical protein V5A44_06985 [Haloarculaceae archaeon]